VAVAHQVNVRTQPADLLAADVEDDSVIAWRENLSNLVNGVHSLASRPLHYFYSSMIPALLIRTV